MRLILPLLLVPLGLLAASPPAAPPLCQVQASSQPDRLPGFYQVTVHLAAACPPSSVADVRLESFVGGSYPRAGWFRVTRERPLFRRGVPWYWRGSWRSQSGMPFPFLIPGLVAP